MKYTTTLWGAAFEKTPTHGAISFAAGRDMTAVPAADSQLLAYDLWLNMAHVAMLAKQKIISYKEASLLLRGLEALEAFAAKDKFILPSSSEDVHSAIESTLTQMIGREVAGKLHTARSRNDQVVTDMRMYMRAQVVALVGDVIGLAKELVNQSIHHKDVVMPGFTHHQHAMVTTWGHLLSGYANMLLRDAMRISHWIALHNYSPLGSSVSYGTALPIDRAYSAKLLGFDGVEANASDSIVNRWEAEADLVFDISVLMNHLSMIAETIIVLSTPEFGMLTVADEFSTGSSIMPQKKNPDMLEVMKGKAAYVTGQLMGLMGLGKGNFVGYNRDSQWAKYLLMDVIRECAAAPTIMKGVLTTLTIHASTMAKQSNLGFIGASSIMEQMTVQYNMPMRVAKGIVEKAVKYSKGSHKVTQKGINKALKEEGISWMVSQVQIKEWQDPFYSIKKTTSWGGPAPTNIMASAGFLQKQIEDLNTWVNKRKHIQATAKDFLQKEIQKIYKKGAFHG